MGNKLTKIKKLPDVVAIEILKANSEFAKFGPGGTAVDVQHRAVDPQSAEMRNPKRYTVRELLASDEAMKDLLHERLLAVRDDLNFAINACNPSASVNSLNSQIAALTRAVESQARHIESLARRFESLARRLRDHVDEAEHQENRLPSVSPAVWKLWRRK